MKIKLSSSFVFQINYKYGGTSYKINEKIIMGKPNSDDQRSTRTDILRYPRYCGGISSISFLVRHKAFLFSFLLGDPGYRTLLFFINSKHLVHVIRGK